MNYLISLLQMVKEFPLLKHLFRPNESACLTLKKLILLLKPVFAEIGSNSRMYQDAVYAKFLKYLREVASKLKENIMETAFMFRFPTVYYILSPYSGGTVSL